MCYTSMSPIPLNFDLDLSSIVPFVSNTYNYYFLLSLFIGSFLILSCWAMYTKVGPFLVNNKTCELNYFFFNGLGLLNIFFNKKDEKKMFWKSVPAGALLS